MKIFFFFNIYRKPKLITFWNWKQEGKINGKFPKKKKVILLLKLYIKEYKKVCNKLWWCILYYGCQEIVTQAVLGCVCSTFSCYGTCNI